MKKQWKINLILTAALLCLALLAACGEAPPADKPAGEPAAASQKALLAVSFGTSYNENRDLSIGAVERALAAAYPDYALRRAFTSQTIIDILAARDGLETDNVTEAMERLVADGFREVVVQPTHVISGYEYDDVVAEISAYAGRFDSLKIGMPLLASDADYQEIVSILADETTGYNDADTALVFMGHGTEHAANAAYARLQQALFDAGYANYFIGTAEVAPTLEDVMALAADSGANKVVLLPLMIVAGDHAGNDMAGGEADSWKSAFAAAGYEVECVLKGLGEYAGVQQMFVSHAAAAMAGENATPAAAAAAARPLMAAQIAPGSYEITVSSSSSMFKIIAATLTVTENEMRAVITLSGDGYGKLYLGTSEEAAAAPDADCIHFVEDAAGKYTYDVPVAALNQEINLAAWSVNKETWYDRVVVFASANIPATALRE